MSKVHNDLERDDKMTCNFYTYPLRLFKNTNIVHKTNSNSIIIGVKKVKRDNSFLLLVRIDKK